MDGTAASPAVRPDVQGPAVTMAARAVVVGDLRYPRSVPDRLGAGRERGRLQRGERLVGCRDRRFGLQQRGAAYPDGREPLGGSRSAEQLARRPGRAHRLVHSGQPRAERQVRCGQQDLPAGLRLQRMPELARLPCGGHVVRVRISKPEDTAAAFRAGPVVADLRLLQDDDVATGSRQ
jgi:hypothetical protein